MHLVGFIIRISLALLIRLLLRKESAITALCDISCGSEIYSRGTRRKVITTRISGAEECSFAFWPVIERNALRLRHVRYYHTALPLHMGLF